MSEESEQLAELIAEFTSAEVALRQLVKAADDLGSAQGSIARAKEELADTRSQAIGALEATRTRVAAELEKAGSSLDDVSSGLYGLISEFKDIARNLKDMATAWRAIGPERIDESLRDLSARLAARERTSRISIAALSVLVIALGVIAIVK